MLRNYSRTIPPIDLIAILRFCSKHVDDGCEILCVLADSAESFHIVSFLAVN